MNAMVLLYRGKGKFGKSQKQGESGNAVFLDKTGGTTFVANADAAEPLKFLLLAGVPLNEPVARYPSLFLFSFAFLTFFGAWQAWTVRDEYAGRDTGGLLGLCAGQADAREAQVRDSNQPSRRL
jgi:hypothetical protein